MNGSRRKYVDRKYLLCSTKFIYIYIYIYIYILGFKEHGISTSLPLISVILWNLPKSTNSPHTHTHTHTHTQTHVLHHHIVLLAWISLILSRRSFLSSIASSKSSKLHPVFIQSCCRLVLVCWPTLTRLCKAPLDGIQRTQNIHFPSDKCVLTAAVTTR